MKFIFQVIFIIGFVGAKAFTPLGNPIIETLEVNGKNRDYIVLKDDAIEYEIEGPKLVTLNSRKPVPKIQNNSSVKFSYKIKLDDIKGIQHDIETWLDKKTISKKHPAHIYSDINQVQINIPKGKHILKINSDDEPLLFRLIKKKKPKRLRSDIYVDNINNQTQVNVITGKKTIPYSIISTNEVAFYKIDDLGSLWLYVRAIHKDNAPGLYPIVLSYDDDSLDSVHFNPSKYIFYSEISQKSKIEDFPHSVGKFRTILIQIRKISSWGAKIRVKVLTEDVDVLVHGEFIPSE